MSSKYYGNTPLYIRINGDEYIITFKKLFERYENFVQVLYPGNEILDFTSFKSHLEVWDGEEFTPLLKVFKDDENPGNFYIYSTPSDFGILLDGSRILLKDGSKVGIQDSWGKEISDLDTILPPTIEGAESIKLPEKFIYYLGYAMGDGDITDDGSEKFDFDKLPINYLNYFCPNMFGCVREGNNYNKHLPISFFKWHKDCMSTFIAGLIDASGEVDEGVCKIKTKSYALAVGLYDAMKYVGLPVNKKYIGTSFSLSFLPNEKVIDWSNKYHSKFRGLELPDFEEKKGNQIINVEFYNCRSLPSFGEAEFRDSYYIRTGSGKIAANGMIGA